MSVNVSTLGFPLQPQLVAFREDSASDASSRFASANSTTSEPIEQQPPCDGEKGATQPNNARVKDRQPASSKLDSKETGHVGSRKRKTAKMSSSSDKSPDSSRPSRSAKSKDESDTEASRPRKRARLQNRSVRCVPALMPPSVDLGLQIKTAFKVRDGLSFQLEPLSEASKSAYALLAAFDKNGKKPQLPPTVFVGSLSNRGAAIAAAI